jgi:hypothetical protein
MPNNPERTTTLGTPCARSWTEDWITAVNAKETELNHRICGARLPDATPCCNTSDHPSGRCQFHGGFDLTGAPPGNRNAHIHGLYSRRLRTCTPDCPLYQTCPCANALEDRSDRPSPSDPSISSPCPPVAWASSPKVHGICSDSWARTPKVHGICSDSLGEDAQATRWLLRVLVISHFGALEFVSDFVFRISNLIAAMTRRAGPCLSVSVRVGPCMNPSQKSFSPESFVWLAPEWGVAA